MDQGWTRVVGAPGRRQRHYNNEEASTVVKKKKTKPFKVKGPKFEDLNFDWAGGDAGFENEISNLDCVKILFSRKEVL